jgi:hypothetical protein
MKCINWPITDSEAYWDMNGFSIKPPSGSNWYKQPRNEKFPNSIVFSRSEGAALGSTLIYMNGGIMIAAGAILNQPVRNRNNKEALAAELRHLLEGYQRYWSVNFGESHYDLLLGYDCLKYVGTPKVDKYSFQTNVHLERSPEYREKEINGYFCLHPVNDRFVVIMEARSISSVGTEAPKLDKNAEHFFTSLRFTPISSSTTRLRHR